MDLLTQPADAGRPRSTGALRCRRKFLRHFPRGFRDAGYQELEREYKVDTHHRWLEALAEPEYRSLLSQGRFGEIAARAIRVEQQSLYSMIFSFEKMALRDAVRSPAGARAFAEGLYDFLHGGQPAPERFERWVAVVAGLPRKQTRVLTWPLVTVFGFIAQPRRHIFLKPTVTRAAARAYGFDLQYRSRPSWPVYESLLSFAAQVRRDTRDLGPRDMIDLQSFIWVQGSEEY
jgi:hypothetical protein